jgi:signal transduction histidine kinase
MDETSDIHVPPQVADLHIASILPGKITGGLPPAVEGILDLLSEAVVVADEEERIHYINREAERLIGRPRRHARTWKLQDVFPDVAVHARLGQAVRRRMACRFSMACLERCLWIDGVAVPLADGLLCAFRETTEQRRAEMDLWRLKRTVVRLAATERRRLAADLHDDLGQVLAGASMLAASLRRRLMGRGEYRTAARLEKNLQEAHAAVRNLARGLISNEVEPGRLAGALEQLARHVTEFHGIACSFEDRLHSPLHDTNVSTQMYYIAQEAVNNAARHANARRIRIVAESQPAALTLSVHDDGIGFQEPEAPRWGAGLQIMRHRAGLIGAKLYTRRVQNDRGGETILVCQREGAS